MDWITDEVAVANYVEAQDGALVRRHGFGSVISLDATVSADRATELGVSEVVSCRLIDGAGNNRRVFRRLVEDLRRLVGSNPPVLVHCHAGRSRSGWWWRGT